MRSDTLSDLAKLYHGDLCPSKIDMAHVYKLFFKDKLILNVPRVINMLSGHPLQPGKAQPRRIQKVTYVDQKKTWNMIISIISFKMVPG